MALEAEELSFTRDLRKRAVRPSRPTAATSDAVPRVGSKPQVQTREATRDVCAHNAVAAPGKDAKAQGRVANASLQRVVPDSVGRAPGVRVGRGAAALVGVRDKVVEVRRAGTEPAVGEGRGTQFVLRRGGMLAAVQLVGGRSARHHHGQNSQDDEDTGRHGGEIE